MEEPAVRALVEKMMGDFVTNYTGLMTRADGAMVQLQQASSTTAAAVTDMQEKSEALFVKVAEHETKLEKAAENF